MSTNWCVRYESNQTNYDKNLPTIEGDNVDVREKQNFFIIQFLKNKNEKVILNMRFRRVVIKALHWLIRVNFLYEWKQFVNTFRKIACLYFGFFSKSGHFIIIFEQAHYECWNLIKSLKLKKIYFFYKSREFANDRIGFSISYCIKYFLVLFYKYLKWLQLSYARISENKLKNFETIHIGLNRSFPEIIWKFSERAESFLYFSKTFLVVTFIKYIYFQFIYLKTNFIL